MDLGVFATVFGLIFIAELPDKTAIAALVLGARYRAGWVFLGVAAAFALHVVIAVAAGSLIALLPHRPVEIGAGALFAIGAAFLWFRGAEDTEEQATSAGSDGAPSGFWRVVGASFAVIFVAEFGDLTQTLCVNLAARYDAPVTVGAAAVLGLWAVGLLAVLGGRSLLRVLPMNVIVRSGALVMTALAIYSVADAVRG